MSEKNVLILQSDVVLSKCDKQRLYEKILEQKEHGVILLPSYVKVLNMPDGKIDGELVVMNRGEFKPEPKEYVIKCYDGRYLYRYGLSIIELTTDKTFAIYFSKSRAEELLKKLGNDYEMEEL